MDILDTVNKLIAYAWYNFHLSELDAVYVRNFVLGELGLAHPKEYNFTSKDVKDMTVPDEFIDEIESYLVSKGYSEKEAELKTIKIMGIVSPRPSRVAEDFFKIKEIGSDLALDFLYNLSIKNYYVQKTKIDKNVVWKTNEPSKNIEISINLSKPEKSNKDIAKLLVKGNEGEKYPKCLLCLDNLGFFGSATQPARENIRIIPVDFGNDKWYLQYSPYGYFYKHCIVFSEKHSNMVINRDTFKRLCHFVDEYPSFFIGSNADLPIVGGSILNHEHYQGGKHILPVMEQNSKKEYKLTKYKSTSLSLLDWYNTCLLLKGEDQEEIISIATKILSAWRKYDDLDNEIISKDKDGEHNTITPSIKKVGDEYYLYLILRNNRCSKEYPDGIFHAHPEYHMIKKEGIGIIEAMGLFILPARLIRQENEIKDVLAKNLNDEEIVKKYEDLGAFLPMIHELKKDYDPSTIDESIKKFIENTCRNILKNTAVFKDDKKGEEGLDKFIGGLNI